MIDFPEILDALPPGRYNLQQICTTIAPLEPGACDPKIIARRLSRGVGKTIHGKTLGCVRGKKGRIYVVSKVAKSPRETAAVPPPLPLPSIAAGRKQFYDYLDSQRPWARGKDAYEMMEEMVDAAAFAFRRDDKPTLADLRVCRNYLLLLTGDRARHPEGYEGPCACEECRAS